MYGTRVYVCFLCDTELAAYYGHSSVMKLSTDKGVEFPNTSTSSISFFSFSIARFSVLSFRIFVTSQFLFKHSDTDGEGKTEGGKRREKKEKQKDEESKFLCIRPSDRQTSQGILCALRKATFVAQ